MFVEPVHAFHKQMRMTSFAFALAAHLIVGCGAQRRADKAHPLSTDTQVTLLTAVDLPFEDARTRELSGIAWDAQRHILYAVSDTVPIVVPLTPSADFSSWTLGEPFTVDVPDSWDGEGLVLSGDSFLIANERGPFIYQIDRAGKLSSKVELPEHFKTAIYNRSLESLSLTPDGRYLFTANESTLTNDGQQPTTSSGATIRIYRRELATGAQHEFAYRTDPLFAAGAKGGDMGVSDMLAISATDVLVMERSYVAGVGNWVRIYRAQLDGKDVLHVPALTLETPVAKKQLFVDFATIPEAGMAGQGGKVLPNYEGLSFGPRLPDGRRIIFVVSDNNANPELVARILVLAVKGIP